MAVAKVAYFPGCSLEGFGKSYDESAKFTARALGVELATIDDYSCCGAIEAKRADELSSYLLPARNLALAKKHMNADSLVTPCNGCHYTMRRATTEMKKRPTLVEDVNQLLGEAGAPAYDGTASVQHVLEFIYQRAGLERVRAAVRQPLKGLTIAPYYGCLYTRPKRYTGVGKAPGTDDPEHPHFLDELLEACGARVIRDFSAKTICCGGGHAISDLEVSVAFSASILNEARRAGADLVATICPLGQINIENHLDRIRAQYGEDVVRPVAYFTQLMSLAFGASVRRARFQDNFSRPDLFLRARGFA